MSNQNQESNYFIYLAVLAVNLISFTSGGCFSWASPILPNLRSTDPNINPLPRPTTTFEESWIASIMNLGAILGSLVGGVCSERYGKKKTLLMLGVPMVISHLLCAFAINIHFFLVARFIIGIGVGTVFGVVPGYVGDIAEERDRGFLGCMLGVFSACGVLFMYLVGPFVSVKIFSLINVIPMILFYIVFGFFIPESPYDLARFGNETAAKESLTRLRNKNAKEIEMEIAFIVYDVKESLNNPKNVGSLFKDKACVKGLIISNCMMFFQQFSGICAVLGYMQIIFESTGSSIPSVYSALLIGFIQFFASVVCAQLVERAGRKILLLISQLFSMITLVSLGTYFYLKTSGINVDHIWWLPIASIIIYVISFNLGLGCLPWVLLSELFSPDIKAFASTITSFFVFLLSFVVTMGFPYLSAAVGMAGSFWMFAALLSIGLAFTFVCVPETKGKSNHEIQNMLRGIRKEIECL